MRFREEFEKVIDFIDSKRKIIVTASISVLGVILLVIMLLVSSDEYNVGKEASKFLKDIENRKYSSAIGYYNDLEKEFSPKKMGRLNKKVYSKINKLLLNSGDKFINGQITKEQYTGLISTINALDNIEIDLKKIAEQASRVNDMYISENLKYDTALYYIQAVSSLNGMGNDLEVYKQKITVVNDSRNMYKIADEYKYSKKYYEAITAYNKVLEEDNKYYEDAQKSIKECIELMYDYYIEKSEEANELGSYEEALQYVDYLKKYYPDDEKLLSLESEYQTNLSLYTLTSNDIINLISKKSGKNKDELSINSFQQMISGIKYYYVEVFESNELIDEILVDAKTRKIYSYKDSKKDYHTEYSDGYFKGLEDGSIEFAIGEEQAQIILEKMLKEDDIKYKNISILPKDKVIKYVEAKDSLDKMLEKNKDIYYYALVNKGIFKKKEVYIVNMYNKKVYSTSGDSIKGY